MVRWPLTAASAPAKPTAAYTSVKPFYYYHKDGTFLFGSEIKSFLAHPDFQKELFEEKLPDFMTFGCIPGAETFFRNVYKLLPGHYFTYEEGRLTVSTY